MVTKGDDDIPQGDRVRMALWGICSWVWTWLSDKGSEIFGVIFSMVFAIGTIARAYLPFSDRVMVVTLGACAFLSAVCSLISLSKKEKMSSLKEQLRNAELFSENSSSAIKAAEESVTDSCEDLLKDLAKELKFENSERITLYLYDEEGRYFRPIARVSSNTQIEELGDLIHSCDKGCLGEAWRDGHAKCSAPPRVTTKKGTIRDAEWVKWCCRLGFTEDEARKISFKALEYFGWRVQHGNFEKKLAILMLESSQRERWNTKELLVRLNSDVKRWSDLLKLVNRFTSLIPSKEVARRRQM